MKGNNMLRDLFESGVRIRNKKTVQNLVYLHHTYKPASVSFSLMPPETGKHFNAVRPRMRCNPKRTSPKPPAPSSPCSVAKQANSSAFYFRSCDKKSFPRS